jgi:hypothetical protein
MKIVTLRDAPDGRVFECERERGPRASLEVIDTGVSDAYTSSCERAAALGYGGRDAGIPGPCRKDPG